MVEIEEIHQDIDKLAESKGEDAKKSNIMVRKKLDSLIARVKSVNLKNDIKNISKKADSLVDKTGSSASKLASEIKTDLNGIRDRIALQQRLENLGSDLDNLADATGEEASELGNSVKSELKSAVNTVKSIDIGDEIKEIMDKVDRLVDYTGDAAKKLLAEIKTDIKRIIERI